MIFSLNRGEGNQAPYPSGRLPLYDHPLYRGWAEQGTDIVGLVLQETRRRGLEAFFSHRMNGSDNDLGPFAVIPAKAAHPEWTFRTPWCTHEHNRYWDFSHPEVREYALENMREVAERGGGAGAGGEARTPGALFAEVVSRVRFGAGAERSITRLQ